MMKPIKYIMLAVFPAISFFACKQEQKQASSTGVPEQQPAKPEVFLYVTTVDKLNLRDQPGKNGQVIAQLAEGEFVDGTGEVSENKEEVTLRDIMYLEPYFQVVTRASEPKTGWVFGGALQRVYAGSRPEIPDLEKLASFTGFLKTLDAKKLDSGKKAWDYVSANFSSANGSLADAGFILLEQFLFRMEREGEFYTLTEKMEWKSEDYEAIANHKFDMGKNPVTQSLAENGFELAQGEGMVFPVVDWNRLQAFFGAKVTPAMKVYLDQEVKEGDQPAWDDGGIIISLEELADRAAFWEKFNRENPHFALTEETKESERWTRLVLVSGADNTPIYNSENQDITNDYKSVWAYIQQKYPGTKLAGSTKEIADLCAAEGWKRTKKVEDWQMKFAEGN